MAGKIVSRDAANLILAGIMAVALAGALATGTVGIVRYGKPDAASAMFVAETFAWIFAAAFLTTFALALQSLVARRTEH